MEIDKTKENVRKKNSIIFLIFLIVIFLGPWLVGYLQFGSNVPKFIYLMFMLYFLMGFAAAKFLK